MPASHPDVPPVAATESGGPPLSPGVLERPHKYAYEGFFVQTGPEPKHNDFEALLDRAFGLLDTSPERWANLRARVAELNAAAPAGVSYKVCFFGRHGQGWHNLAANQYGVEPWETHWTYLLGDGTLTWGPDPQLTPLGRAQAAAVHATWQREAAAGAPVKAGEMAWFVSPLTRTGETLLGSWGELLADTPEVWEDWREIYGSHTCDKRSTRTEIAARFPGFRIEPDLTEHDELWTPDERESDAHMQLRMRRAMDRVFDTVDETYVSVTGHSAIFRNLLAVLGHQPYPLATGEMIPVVVKATRLA